MGYEPDTKGYTLWDRHSQSFIISRDVRFDEATFPSCSDLGNQRPPFPIPSSSIPTGESFQYPVDVVFPGVSAQPPPAPPQPPQAPQLPEEQPNVDEAPKTSSQEDRPHTPPNQPQPPPETEFHTPPTHPTATSPPASCKNHWSNHHPRDINPIPPPAFTPLEENRNRDIPVELPAMPELRRSNRP